MPIPERRSSRARALRASLRPARRAAAIAGFALATMASHCNTVPEPTPAPGSWLVLLCKASDAPTEPHPASFYRTLFDPAQPDLLWEYFDVESNHTLDVSHSEVFGWFPMSVKTADISPAVRNNGTPVKRSQTLADCKASALGGIAATGTSVDPANYIGTITVINVPVDAGAAGSKGLVLSDQAEGNIGFVEHEMLHVLGLKHSFTAAIDPGPDHAWHSGTDTEYQDCWDMMSYQTCVYTYASSRGQQGDGLQAAYREQLHWLPSMRVFDAGTVVGAPRTITLAPLSDPAKPGFLLAKMEVPGGEYVMEYREPSGHDQAMPGPIVLIRERRDGGKTYLVTRSNNYPAWPAGDTFTDLANFLSVHVNAIAPGGASVTINTAYSVAAGQNGDRCGDKYRGQVIACAAPLQCGPKRLTPPLITVDYFCLP